MVAVQDRTVDRAAPPFVEGARYLEPLARGTDESMPWAVPDERAIITINCTSGTTGQPKGAKYTHRGAYVGTFGGIMHSGFTRDSVYLWTLPCSTATAGARRGRWRRSTGRRSACARSSPS